MGFDELRLAGRLLPSIQYWRGISEALSANGIEVITASVPASASIEDRAARLSHEIESKAGGKSVNIVAYVALTGLSLFELLINSRQSQHGMTL